jgi:hypothetical protein
METLVYILKLVPHQRTTHPLFLNLYGRRHVGRTQRNIFVEHVVLGVRRRGVLKFVQKVGVVLAEQVAHYFGMPVERPGVSSTSW